MPLRGKSRLRPNALATVLHAIPLALLLATASSASGQQPASTPSGIASGAAACHDPAGWNIACLRARYSGPAAAWPAPTIDAGVQWHEWAPVPPVASPPLQWTAANPGQAELAADVARPAVVALGQMLFFDTRLSRKGEVSCASCHQPQRAFTDGLPLAVGEDKLMGRRRSTPLYAAPFAPRLFWDGRAASLKEQVMGPLHDPREMNHDAAGAVARLRQTDMYSKRFLEAFGGAPVAASPAAASASPTVASASSAATSTASTTASTPASAIDADRLARALAAYVASLRPERTRFDDFLAGRADALDDTELLGLHLFRTQARCMNCHNGPLLTDHKFHNIGLSFYGRRNQDLGRYEATRDPADLGRFRTPSLRNVAQAGPWMHNGLFPDLRGLLRMYNAGMGREAPPADPPDPHAPRKSAHIKPLDLSPAEIDALLAFLKTL
ncbi:cytochrome-c peroxidase [Achromobacter xylosoxidans]|uniref:cytochrome-c peroxidase n=3 Tax=Alcaligenes xylosoxydans xylosoxydans TaxID=85698 RepID=UPI0006C466D9|nr:cytochrome c peroxidase [Achromobacter xylosoxidans]OFL40109.1 cytochrome-c peroxidase [Achromobacter xylosoxidans]OFS55995.1 cytochrome-c peroxidase [Achromobacter xylosoxidans]CUI46604.1 Cytochrome c551 peroxidase precursor [Achromobacter xylosoxidans]